MDLYIYGAGGTGRELLDIANRKNLNSHSWGNIYFIDDFGDQKDLLGTSIFRLDDVKQKHDLSEIIIAVGEPQQRGRLFDIAFKSGFRFGRLINSEELNSSSVEIDEGVVIYPNSVVSNRSKLKKNVMIQFNTVVGHDIEIGEHSVISSGVVIGGNVAIGERVFIGMGACIKEGVKIGSNSIVGMGSVVYNDIPDGVIALGNPARVARPNSDQKVFK
jgi:sugar O-acyltransferase (sialic acid O-acetyltransferase NeuD family)